MLIGDKKQRSLYIKSVKLHEFGSLIGVSGEYVLLFIIGKTDGLPD